MAKGPTTEEPENRVWAVYLSPRIQSTRDALFVGTVEAPTSEAAILIAVKKFHITSPQVRARLVANRHGW